MDLTFYHLLAVVRDISAIASVVALGFAVYQIHQARQQTKQLSTQFKGNFPAYLSNVADLIRGAKYSIKIMANVPSHGEYSDRAAWLNIKRAIEETLNPGPEAVKAKTFEAILVYSSPHCLMRSFEVQHRGLTKSADEWAKWKLREIAAGRLSRFLRNRPEGSKMAHLDLTRYIEIRIEKDRKAINDTYSEFTLMECAELLPMFCWIADNKKAIFSIRTEDTFGHYTGAGIFTVDQGLVTVLSNMFDHYKLLPTTAQVKPPVSEHYSKASP